MWCVFQGRRAAVEAERPELRGAGRPDVEMSARGKEG